MNKLFVIHYYPIDYFPPVMNLIDSLGEKVEIRVSTLQKSNSLDAYGNKRQRFIVDSRRTKREVPFLSWFSISSLAYLRYISSYDRSLTQCFIMSRFRLFRPISISDLLVIR